MPRLPRNPPSKSSARTRKRTRNYAAEYSRRKQRGLARGLSLAQVRGHPRAGEPPASGKATTTRYNEKLEEGVKAIRRGRPLGAAARDLGVSPEKLRRYLKTADIGEKVRGRWAITRDQRPREELLYTKGRAIHVIVPNYEAASKVGLYMQAVKAFLFTNEAGFLRPFEGEGVTDILGKYHPFETRLNVLYRLDAAGTERFEDVYRILA